MTSRHQVALDRVRENLLDVMGETIRGLMAEPDVTDIILNPPLPGEEHGRLWVSRLGCERQPVDFMSPEQAMRLIGAVASSMRIEATEDTPSVQGHLITDGSRFQGCIPPIVPGPFFAIRKHASAVFPLQSYVDNGQMTEGQKAIIEDTIERRLNLLVVGGTGAGKTTLLNALLLAVTEIHPHHRIFGIEDTRELKCSSLDQTFTLTSSNLDIRALVKIAMRAFADRIIIGEVRDGAALDILKAGNTGHEGWLSTVHANSATSALKRMEQLVAEVSAAPQQEAIADAVNIIVSMQRGKDGKRAVRQILACKGWENGKYVLEEAVPEITNQLQSET